MTTESSKKNLLNENIPTDVIYVTGNTVIDALFFSLKKIDKSEYVINSLNINERKKIILVTGHRRENFGDGFINICKALKNIALKYFIKCRTEK